MVLTRVAGARKGHLSNAVQAWVKGSTHPQGSDKSPACGDSGREVDSGGGPVAQGQGILGVAVLVACFLVLQIYYAEVFWFMNCVTLLDQASQHFGKTLI